MIRAACHCTTVRLEVVAGIAAVWCITPRSQRYAADSGVNVRTLSALDPASVRLQHTHNAHTRFFWTRAPDTFQPGEQSPVESDGWR